MSKDWWLLYEERELTFIDSQSPAAEKLMVVGREHLTKEALTKSGLSHVVFIPENIIELKPPLAFGNITSQSIGTILGEKRKVPILDTATQQEYRVAPMKEWLEYFNQDPAARPAILARFVGRPRDIREIDWIEKLWPQKARQDGEYPGVERYLLMGAAGSYSNFRIDFGGSSVWYNVVKGEKIFLLVPPTEQNLAKFGEWYKIPMHQAPYFSDQVSGVLKVCVKEGESIVIPGGWTHAVYTPVDSIAFGGNFLHGYNFEMQLRIHAVEENLQDASKHRFPYFEEMMWYAGGHYCRLIQESRHDEITDFERRGLMELSKWLKFYRDKKPSDDLHPSFIMDTLRAYENDEKLPNITDSKYIQEEEDSAKDVEGGDCLCKGKLTSSHWIGCSECGRWYHQDCVGLKEKEVDAIEDYYCPRCDETQKQHLPDLQKLIAAQKKPRRGRKRKAEKSESEEPSEKKIRV